MNCLNCLNCNGNQNIRCVSCINKYSNENFQNMINLLIFNMNTSKGKKELIKIFNNPKLVYIANQLEQSRINLKDLIN